MSLWLDAYKVLMCKSGIECESKTCPNFHQPERDFRRRMSDFSYLRERCTRACPHPASQHPRNIVEQKYHPQNYKKKYCKDFMFGGDCPYRDFCSSAHSDMELLIKPLHLMRVDLNFLFFRFKSELCPFSWSSHNAFTCVYAHNWQDFKRPYFAELQAERCVHWKAKKHITEYLDACPNGFACTSCHGWKELDFHPANFKKVDCNKCLGPPSRSLASLDHGDADLSINHQTINFHICSFRHRDEETPSLVPDPVAFSTTPKQQILGPRTTEAFLRELDFFVPIQSNSDPSEAEPLLVDFLRIEKNSPDPPQHKQGSSAQTSGSWRKKLEPTSQLINPFSFSNLHSTGSLRTVESNQKPIGLSLKSIPPSQSSLLPPRGFYSEKVFLVGSDRTVLPRRNRKLPNQNSSDSE